MMDKILYRALVTAIFFLPLCFFGCSKGITSDSPEAIVRKYLNAPAWEDRLAFVRYPEKVKPLMSEHYKDGKFPATFVSIESDPQSSSTQMAEWVEVKVVFGNKTGFLGQQIEDTRDYLLQLTKDGYKIDWEASVGYNSIEWKAYLAQRPTKMIKFRLIGELSDYFNYEFRADLEGRKKYYSIKLSDADGTDVGIHAYIFRGTEEGKKIFELLKDGEPHYMILGLRFLPNSDGDVVLVSRFYQNSWIEEDTSIVEIPDEVLFAREALIFLSSGEPASEKYLDWENLKVLDMNIRPIYNSYSEWEQYSFRKSFVETFATSFRRKGGNINALNNWRLDSENGGTSIVVADFESPYYLRVVVSTFGENLQVREISVIKKK